MEFLLRPFYHTESNTPRTPYVCRERYDGGPWKSYPLRKGRPELELIDGVKFDQSKIIRSLEVNPIPLAEQETFLQTWLYFGLIAEFLGANSEDLEDVSLGVEGKAETLGFIYDTILVQEYESTYIVLNQDSLQTLLDRTMSRIPQEVEPQKARYLSLGRCLMHTGAILNTLPKDFRHTIRFSIAAIGEMFTYIVVSGLHRLKLPLNDAISAPRFWSSDYFNNNMKGCMIENGWCPSDITRCEVNFRSLQSLSIVQTMDRSLPARDHTNCTFASCNAHQIDLGKYTASHREENCQCGEELSVHCDAITKILSRGDQIPLLRIAGGLQNMTVELVDSTPNSKYTAISHVWADGLGNPHANALHRCRLLHLRGLVTNLAKEADPLQDTVNASAPLIWLDTLCVPAKDGEGKRKGLEKIYAVYQRAEHVLVLDSTLMSYDVEPQDISEKAIRIFTSPWFRRLWTLQEGALAKSLYFQFADRAISLHELYNKFPGAMSISLQYHSLFLDIALEFRNLRAFFSADSRIGIKSRDLLHLDRALKFRGVSVPTDEPICIGALMSLDLGKIAHVEPEDRMQMVWTLLASSLNGLPAGIIFLEEQKIDASGWRWAPCSLLQVKRILQPTNRASSLADLQRGTPTAWGFRVKYPGYRITQGHNDSKPRNPWLGFSGSADVNMKFRHVETGQWYHIVDKESTLLARAGASEEQAKETKELGFFPLHDLADTNKSLLLCSATSKDAIFATPNSSTDSRPAEEGSLLVRAERQVMVYPVDAAEGYISDTILKLAHRLREDEITDKHLDVFYRLKDESHESLELLDKKMNEDEEFRASRAALIQKMKDMIQGLISEDERFVRSVKISFGASSLEKTWVFIWDFFGNNYIGSSLSPEQVWFVD